MPPVVVTDLDGTVVPSGDVITPATLAAAARLRDLGVPLVAVTARTPAGVRRLSAFARHLDMPNDLPMFACCGRSVAVGNAHPAVLAAATMTTAAAAEDGFGRGLALLGLG